MRRGSRQATCPIHALDDQWLEMVEITDGPVFRKATSAALTSHGLSRIVAGAVGRAGQDTAGYSGYSLRKVFAT